MAKTLERKLGKATRDAFGLELAQIGKARPEVVVLDADVCNSTRTEYFGKAFPERFFNVGIAESNVVGIAGGLAASGKVPVVASFACFLMANAFDQMRMAVAFPGMNVKLVGSHAGISIGEDGPSQMGIEDVALACALGGMTVVVPADEPAARAATRAIVEHQGPCYLRVGRPAVPIVYEKGCAVTLGKANRLRDGGDVTIVANGLMVAAALEAAETLSDAGIEARVLDMHTVKPIDREAIAAAARETGAMVVAEEHLAHGGLGAAVAYAATELAGTGNPPVPAIPIRYVNLGDRYAESGAPQALLEKYGLTARAIAQAAREDLP